MNLVIEPQSVRFTTSDAVEWRLEITGQQGQLIFDTSYATSTSLVWPLIDSQGQQVATGVYHYVVTARGAQAPRRQRGELALERLTSTYQISAIGNQIGEGTSLTTVASEPGVKSSASAGTPLPTNLGQISFGTVQPYISGTGTTNTMTKWADGPAGIVGDTAVNEYAGAVTIGNGSFYGNLHIFGSEGSDVFAGMGPNLATGPAFNFGYAGGSVGRSAGFFNVRPDASAVAPNPSLRFMTGNVQRMMISNLGNVALGVAESGTIRLRVRGQNAGSGIPIFQLEDVNGVVRFAVLDWGGTFVTTSSSPSTIHLCTNGGYLSSCSSAAEYVPTVKTSHGYPETADLVSISDAHSPYDDDHAPFVVAKSTTPCDNSLVGFIIDPASGADGKKSNDHYLPLAIFGYFPAKVTMENGRIRRGDAITSSSTPGQGMKATSACKVIGYALEDADADRTIQVFANLGHSAGPDMTDQIETVTRENAALKQLLTKMEARLTALEAAVGPEAVGVPPKLPKGDGVRRLLPRLK